MRAQQILIMSAVAIAALAGCSREQFKTYYGHRAEIPVQQLAKFDLDPGARGQWLRANGFGDVFRFTLVEDPKIGEGLDASTRERSERLRADLDECGIVNLGPSCLGQGLESRMSLVRDAASAATRITTAVRVDEFTPELRFDFEFDGDASPKGDVVLKVFEGATQLLQAKLEIDYVPTALMRVDTARSIRELYHLTDNLLQAVKESELDQLNTRLARVFASSEKTVWAPDRVNYEFETLKLLMTRFSPAPSTVVEIARMLLDSRSDDVDQLAATAILTVENWTTSLHSLVIGAMFNPRADLRRLGLLAMGHAIKRPDNETSLLLRGFLDNDVGVRAAAFQIVDSLTFDYTQRPDIMALVVSPDDVAREEGIKLLGQIRAHTQLIRAMVDPNPKLRTQALNLLFEQKLGSYDIAGLEAAFGNADESIRIGVAELLSRIPGDTSRNTLIEHMRDGSTKVRDSIRQILDREAADNDDIPMIASLFSDDNGDVRLAAALLLNTIKGTAATNALIAHLGDTQPHIRDQIGAMLEARDKTNYVVEAYSTQLENPDHVVRTLAAKILVETKSLAGRLAVSTHLSKEDDPSAKAKMSEYLAPLSKTQSLRKYPAAQ